MNNLEQRSTAGTVELRASTGSGKRIGGYALKYDTFSQNLGGFVETIQRGALDKTLAEGTDVLCRYLHRDEFTLGRTSAGTLELNSLTDGLDYTVDVPDTDYGANCLALVARGDLRHSSFAFYTMRDDWSLTEQGFPLRSLQEILLVDTAPVTTPAYMDTSTGLRSLAEHRGVDLGVVMERAKDNALAELLADRAAATVIDLGGKRPVSAREARDQAQSAREQARALSAGDDRDVLLQVIGALDAACDTLCDATETLEVVAAVTPAGDADEVVTDDGEPPQMNALAVLATLRAKALPAPEYLSQLG